MHKSAKEIISDLASDAEIKKICKSINLKEWDDLYQELFVILCEYDEKKLEKVFEKGYLKYFVIRTILNLASPTGKDYQYKKNIVHVEEWRQITEETDEDGGQQEFIRQREIIGDILREIEQGGREKAAWYKVNLLKLYAENNNISDISRITGIPRKAIKYDIQTFTRELSVIIDKRI